MKNFYFIPRLISATLILLGLGFQFNLQGQCNADYAIDYSNQNGNGPVNGTLLDYGTLPVSTLPLPEGLSAGGECMCTDGKSAGTDCFSMDIENYGAATRVSIDFDGSNMYVVDPESDCSSINTNQTSVDLDLSKNSTVLVCKASNGNLTIQRIAITEITALPIELNSFTAEVSEKHNVMLNWNVQNQINVNHFEVEHALDGFNFKRIGAKQSINTANYRGELSYDYLHSMPAAGNNYYRLKTVDFDGSYSYSDVIIINVEKDITQVVISPNPVNGQISIELPSAGNDINPEVTIQVFTVQDQLVKSFIVGTVESGNVEIGLDELNTGLYIVRVQQGSDVYSKLIVKN